MTKIGKQLAVLAGLANMLAGCVLGPRSDAHHTVEFRPAMAEGNLLGSNRASKPKIALAGVLQRDSYGDEKADRTILAKPEDLAPILKSLSYGLSEVSTIKTSMVYDVTAEIVCPPLKDMKSALLTGLYDQTCKLPQTLESSVSVEKLRLSGMSHLIFLVGETQIIPSGTSVTWGFAGGGRAAIPAFTSESKVGYFFKISATVYDLSNLASITEASALDVATGSYGLMLIIYPYYVRPSEEEYLVALAKAIGVEIGRRFMAPNVSEAQ